MGNTNVIEVYADYIYYIPVGDKDRIDFIRDTLTAAGIEKYVEYFSVKTIVPIAFYKEMLEHHRKLIIKLDPVVEEAQAHAYASYESNNSYMLICLKSIDDVYVLTPPRYVMVDGNDPEKGLVKEFSRLSNRKLDIMLANTIKPAAIISKNKDTILYISKFTSRKSFDDDNLNNLLKFLEELDKKKK
ncbi:MAG: hypothetical protein Hyperionvirus9_18 [Hyperionvirus sp.]|uniref:Uncharacterized protein n=1 Tax=Hyperionvirus sp. TaxID=2487770 RepID=A0A3G5ABF7_9VIRU|nr:MAG: hypothetical protein Hyperionvirus9_18 [Hyperionvirus sp.]